VNTANPISAQLLDSIRSSLVALAEIGGNRLLEFDPETLQGCRELRGLCIEVDVTDLDFRLYCHPGDWGIRLSSQAPAREVTLHVDAEVPGIDEATFLAQAEDAKENCPVSKVLAGAEITLNARLVT